jgi:hypothetical protein
MVEENKDKIERVNRTVYADLKKWAAFKARCAQLNKSMTNVIDELIDGFMKRTE